MKKWIIVCVLITVVCLVGNGCAALWIADRIYDKINPPEEPSPEFLSALTVIVTPEQRQVSPSGKYVLEMVHTEYEETRSFYFVIRSAEDDTVLYVCDSYYRLRDTHYLLWDDTEDMVWVYSGDVGTYFWRKENNEWVKYGHYDYKDSVEQPPALVELTK